MKSRDIANMGIAIALLFVTGYVVYIISKPLILPGAKFLLMAPLLSYLQYIPIIKNPKSASILVLNTGFGILLALVSPLMAVAIILSGLMSALVFELLGLVLRSDLAIQWGLSSYPMWAMLISFYISVEITGLNIYGDVWNITVGVVALSCLFLGKLGVIFAVRTIKKIYPTDQ